MNGAIYQLSAVRKSYAGRTILAIEHLEIMRGEIFALVGPSGSGKSTLLRLLALLESPTDGRVQFDETAMESTSAVPGPVAARRRLAMVFQHPVLLNTTVSRNVAYGLRLRATGRIEEKVCSALAQIGLSDFGHSPARKLSGGEMQRVAIARAVVLDPEVLLLDEPTANLDPYNVRLIESMITQLNRSRGTTIVLVTHNVFQARRLAHRTALLLSGELVETNETNRFFTAPNDLRTAAFVRGEMVY